MPKLMWNAVEIDDVKDVKCCSEIVIAQKQAQPNIYIYFFQQ